MGQPQDPGQQYQQGQMPPPPAQPQVVYVQAPERQAVNARRGMSAAGHGFNWTLTFWTCGMWLPIYWSWWATVRSWQAWRNWRNRKKHYKVYG